jgi:hypothetical protein
MKGTIRIIGEQKMIAAMTRYKQIIGKEVSQQVKNHARLLCVELGKQTQPFGYGKESLYLGEDAVIGDIRANVIGLSPYWLEQYEAVHGAGGSNGLYRKDGTMWISDTHEIARGLGALKDKYEKLRRKQTGRPPKRGARDIGRWVSQTLIVTSQDLVEDTFIPLKRRAVGWAKGSWAAAAMQCGADVGNALRGFPPWVKRHAAKAPGSANKRGIGMDTMVYCESGTGYTGRILSKTQRSNSVNLVRGKFIRFINYAIKGELKRRAGLNG